MGRSVNGSRVLLLGLAYKRNTGDAREAPGHGHRPVAWSPSAPTCGWPIPTWPATPSAFPLVELTAERARRRPTPWSWSPTTTPSTTTWSGPRPLRARHPQPAGRPDRRAALTPRVKVVVTGGAGFIGANLCRALTTTPGVDEVVALDDLSTGSAGQPGRASTASSWSRARSSTPTCSTRSSPAPTPSSTWPPARRCPGRSPTPWPPTRPTPPARSGSSRRPATTAAATSSWPRRRRSTAPTPPCPSSEDMAPMPVSPYAVEQAGRRVLRPGLRPLVRPAGPGLPVLQRLRAPAGRRPRLRRRRPGLPGRALRGRAAARPRRREPDPGLHLRGHGVLGAGRRRRPHGVRPPAGQPGLRDPGLAPRADRPPRAGPRPEPRAQPHSDPRAGDVRDSQADQTNLRRLFPDVRPVPLDEGLRATIAWFEES